MAGEKKAPIRWDWIEERWQEFTLSNVAIGVRHGELFGRKVDEKSIRLRVSQFGWQREKGDAVLREVQVQLAERGIPEELRAELRGFESETPNSPKNSEGIPSDLERKEASKVYTEAVSKAEVAHRQLQDIARMRKMALRMEAYVSSMLPLHDDGSSKLVYEPGELQDIVGAASTTAYTFARIINTERTVLEMNKPGAPTSINDDGTLRQDGKKIIPLTTLNVTVNKTVRVDPIDNESEPAAGTVGAQ